MNPILSTALTIFPQIRINLAVAVDATTLQSELLDQTG
jgi:hypothetical protein